MKQIRIQFKGQWVNLLYKVNYDYTKYGKTAYTDFFSEETYPERKRKYRFFGPYITRIEHKFLFRIWSDAYNEELSKDFWREKIIQHLNLMRRREELRKGELI